MSDVKLIDIREEILEENRGLAAQIRRELSQREVFFLNLMGSPGSGKTSLIIRTLERLQSRLRLAVIESDVDSQVDSRKIAALGIPTVQIQTGGACHTDAAMVQKALATLPMDNLDAIILENIGNLICPAESDTGAMRNVVILSVPEGDDKPLKYPLIFSLCDVLIINKTDYMDRADFNQERLISAVAALNKKIVSFDISCRTSAGMDPWVRWLENEISAVGG